VTDGPATTTQVPPPVVAVIGAGRATPAEERAAEAIGARLASAGAVVVTGGRGGVMAAASRGAAAAGGLTIGLLPGTTREEANPWVQIALPTGLGEARNVLVVRAADTVVAVGGEHGTLSELGLALKLGVPVVGLDTWVVSRRGEVEQAIVVATSPDEAADLAIATARPGGSAR
jgi:uncharacterized protein (TIGR00725 family)